MVDESTSAVAEQPKAKAKTYRITVTGVGSWSYKPRPCDNGVCSNIKTCKNCKPVMLAEGVHVTSNAEVARAAFFSRRGTHVEGLSPQQRRPDPVEPGLEFWGNDVIREGFDDEGEEISGEIIGAGVGVSTYKGAPMVGPARRAVRG